MKMKSLLLLLLSFLATSAHAHVRWFIDADTVPQVPFVFNLNTVVTLVLIAIYLAGVIIFNRYAQTNKALAFMKKDWGLPLHIHWYLVIALLNTVLIYCLLYGEYIAPNLVLPPMLIPLGIALQAAVLVLLPFSVALVGVALIVVGFLNLVLFGFAIGIDYFFELVGVGLAFIFIGPYISKVDGIVLKRFQPQEHQWQDLAVHTLRIALGLQLLTLAIHNKFIDTGYSLLFVEEHSFYNFMQALGINGFSHVDFVYMVGLFEGMFGIALCFGIATRLVSMTLAIIFTLTAIFSGITEVFGHLPIMAVVLVLILKGEVPMPTLNITLPRSKVSPAVV